MKKKVIMGTLLLASVASLAACGKKADNNAETEQTAAITQSEETETKTQAETTETTPNEENAENTLTETKEKYEGPLTEEKAEELLAVMNQYVGIQLMGYGSVNIDTFGENVAVPASVCYLSGDSSEYVESADGEYGMVSKDQIDEVAMDFFGEKYDLTSYDENNYFGTDSFEITFDEEENAYFILGDWGTMAPKMEIVNFESMDENEENYEVIVHHFFYDYEADAQAQDQPETYISYSISKSDTSVYGYVIKNITVI